MNKKILIIPVYNKSFLIEKAIRLIGDHLSDFTVLFVDDGSVDNTIIKITPDEQIKYLKHELHQGYGASLISGFEFAIMNEFDKIYTADIDYPDFYKAVHDLDDKSDSYDMVNCSRIEIPENKERLRRIGVDNRISVRLNTLLDLYICDFFSPFKYFNAEIIKKIDFTEYDMNVIIQIWIQSLYNKAVLCEVFSPCVSKETINESDVLKRDYEYYFLFMDGEIILYPL